MRARHLLATCLLSLALAACGGGTSHHGSDVVTGEDGLAPDLVGQDSLSPDDLTRPDEVSPTDLPTPPDAGDTSPPSCEGLAALLAEARFELERGQSYWAFLLYEEAEALCPDDAEARFGAALSGMVDTVELGLSFLSVADQAFIAELPELQSQDDWAAETIHEAMFYLAARFRAALARLDTLVEADLRVSYDLVPVYRTTRPLLVYRGEFDTGDVHLMRAMAQGLVFILDVLVTQDFRAEIMSLIPVVRALDGGGAETILLAVGRVLSAGPQALGVHPVDGAEAYAEAGAMLAAFDESLASALAWLRAEAPGEEGTQVSYLQENSTETLAILRVQAKATHVEGQSEPQLGDLVFRVPADLSAALAQIRQSVEQPGQPVSWAEGPVWLLAAMVNIVFQTGVVGDIDLGGLSLPLDRMDIATLASTLKNLVPLPFTFDFGTFFAVPTGLRSFLPRATESGDSVVMDWECPTETADDGYPNGAGGLLCDSADALMDGPHFVGTSDEIEADGVLSALPYLGFADPSWNGLLLVDEADIGLSEIEGYQPATLRSINAGLAVGLKPILDLLVR